MSYTKSQAGIGLGSTLSINTGTIATPVWTIVGEISQASLSGRQAATTQVTNLQSLASEFIPTLISEGDLALSGNRISTDAGQLAIEAAFNSLKLAQFKLQLPVAGAQTTTGDLYSFTALVTDSVFVVSFDKAINYDVKLKISGLMTFTAGS